MEEGGGSHYRYTQHTKGQPSPPELKGSLGSRVAHSPGPHRSSQLGYLFQPGALTLGSILIQAEQSSGTAPCAARLNSLVTAPIHEY